MLIWRLIWEFDPRFDPRFSPLLVGLPFWEIAASLGRRAMDTALRRMLFVFCCGAMLSLPMGFSALLPLMGFVNEPKISTPGCTSGTHSGKTFFLGNSSVMAMVPLEQANSQVKVQNVLMGFVNEPKISAPGCTSGTHSGKTFFLEDSSVMAMVPLEQANSQIEVPNVLSVPKDTTWMIPLFLVSAGTRWSSVVGTLIWAWFQPSISQGYQMIPKVLAWPFNPQKVTPKAIFWSTIMVFNLGNARVDAVCPMCNGYGVGCTWATNQRCPAVDEPISNRDIITGATTGVISLAKCLPARFLRAFTRAELTAVTTIAARPPPGTPVTITVATKLKEISVYLNQGLISMEQVSMLYAGFIDDEDDEDKKKTLMYNLKLLMSMKDLPGVVGAQAETGEPYGVLTWLLAMVASFVAAGTIVAKTTLGPADASTSSGTGSRHVAKLVRPKTMVDLFELMNLYIMFYTSLGLGSTILITQFFEFVIFDTIRIRRKQWPVAFELLVVLLRKVENTVELTIGNVMQEVYLNSAMEEAVEAAKTNYVAFFRSPQLAAASETEPTDVADKQVMWNNKCSRDPNATPCLAFNLGKEHSARFLKKDGTCKHKHVCDHWVSNKGPGGRCLGTEGTPGHSRADCDNPHRCESKQQ